MPTRRQPDRIELTTDHGTFDRFSRLEVTNDVAGPSEAIFEVGDDGAWPELERIIQPGEPVGVWLNGKPRFMGKAEVNEVPANNAAGVVIQVTVRTIMADARYASADPKIKVKDSSLKDLILAAYAGIGLTERDFVFSEFVARDLMTGKTKGHKPPFDVEPIKVAQAKVNPPETIFDLVERTLRRHRATHWDGPDGRIIVGRPDDEQPPTYRLQAKRGPASVANNVGELRRVKDWSEAPSRVVVKSQTLGKGTRSRRHTGIAVNEDVEAVIDRTGFFQRLVVVPNQGAKTKEQADAAARRELSARSRRMDAYEFSVDGWTYWTGREQIPWAHNTIADVDVDALGGVQGRQLIVRVTLSLDTASGPTSKLVTIRPDLWVL